MRVESVENLGLNVNTEGKPGYAPLYGMLRPCQAIARDGAKEARALVSRLACTGT